VFVVYSSEEEGVFEHRHWIIQSAFFFELLVTNNRLSIVFDLVDPGLLFKAAYSIAESFFLSPEDFVREEAWESDVNGLTEMELFDSISGALYISRKVEIVLHESFVKEWLPDLKSMSGSRSVYSKDIKLIKLFYESHRLKCAVSFAWLILEIKISLSHLVGALTRVDDDII
jgi:hypothetical protein